MHNLSLPIFAGTDSEPVHMKNSGQKSIFLQILTSKNNKQCLCVIVYV